MNEAGIRQLKQQRERFNAVVTRLESLDTHFREVIAFYENTGESDDLRRPGGEILKDDIFAVLNSEGRPLHPAAIMQRLHQKGIVVPGENKGHNLVSHMSGDARERFQATGSGAWGLTQWKDHAQNSAQEPLPLEDAPEELNDTEEYAPNPGDDLAAAALTTGWVDHESEVNPVRNGSETIPYTG